MVSTGLLYVHVRRWVLTVDIHVDLIFSVAHSVDPNSLASAPVIDTQAFTDVKIG
jgi:hypothetical protein